MSASLRVPEPADDGLAAFRQAMRGLVGGVCVLTAGSGDERTGLTVTSAVSLSMTPPSMLVCVNRAASALPVIESRRRACLNILHAGQELVARRFAGAARGGSRYEGAQWRTLDSGVSALVDAVAAIELEIEEIIVRHTHAVLVGAVAGVHLGAPKHDPLLYAHGRYRVLDPT